MERFEIKRNEPLTAEQEKRLSELQAMSDAEIIFDEDCRELTDEQLSRMVRLNEKIRKPA